MLHLPDGYRYGVLTGRLRWFTTGARDDAGLDTPPSISADGRRIAFSSFVSSLVPGDGNGTSDVFVWDRTSGGPTLISVALGGGPGNSGSDFPAISGDGCWVAFGSYATDLADLGGGGSPEAPQVFARGALCGG